MRISCEVVIAVEDGEPQPVHGVCLARRNEAADLAM
jgi:hypothetical protein